MHPLRLGLSSLIALGVLAAPATAGPPNVAKTEIVIGKSIGAVKIGMKRTAALNAWGYQNSDCEPDDGNDFCFWETGDSLSSLRFSKGKLWSITIMGKNGKAGFAGEFRFAPLGRVGATHPEVHQSLKQNPPEGKIRLTKKVDQVTSPDGKTTTSFIYTGKKVTAIQISGPQ